MRWYGCMPGDDGSRNGITDCHIRPQQYRGGDSASGRGTSICAIAARCGAPLTACKNVTKLLRQPAELLPILRARLSLWRAHQAPISVRVWGRVLVGGGGRIEFGRRVRIFGTAVRSEFMAWPGARLSIGDGTFINYGVSISACLSVTIGSDCQIGQYTIINDNDYHDVVDKTTIPRSGPVVIGDRVWLGARVIINKGVTVGDDAVIGAGSVVTHDIPARSIAAGVPARVVRGLQSPPGPE